MMLRLLPIGLFVVLADQALKWWVSIAIAPGETRIVLPALLNLTHVYNPGAAFGLFPSQQWLFIVAAAGVLLYAWLQRAHIERQPFLMQFGIVLGLGGALGNLIDRVWRGAVLDFVDVFVIPVFNVADMAITVGVACIIWTVLFDRTVEGKDLDEGTFDKEGDEAWKN